MKTAISFVLAIAVLGAVGVTTTVMSSAITAHARGPPSQSNPNPVAGSAVGNKGIKQIVKNLGLLKSAHEIRYKVVDHLSLV